MATVLHHSCDVGRESYNVPRHQKMATAREEVVNEPYDALRGLTTPPPEERPGILPSPCCSEATAPCGASQGPPSRPLACPALEARRKEEEEEEKERKDKEHEAYLAKWLKPVPKGSIVLRPCGEEEEEEKEEEAPSSYFLLTRCTHLETSTFFHELLVCLAMSCVWLHAQASVLEAYF